MVAGDLVMVVGTLIVAVWGMVSVVMAVMVSVADVVVGCCVETSVMASVVAMVGGRR